MLLDLSHPLANGVPSFPGDPAFVATPHATHQEQRVSVTSLTMGSHQGTHLDAPFHFYAEGKTIDEMPLEPFYGPAQLIDLAPGKELAPNTELTVETFLPHADAFEAFTDFPSITPDAAEWIADTGIALLGMDLPTPGKDAWGTHLPLLAPGVEIVIVEALRNLDRLPIEFTLAAFPLNLKGIDGSPVRAVAIIE